MVSYTPSYNCKLQKENVNSYQKVALIVVTHGVP